MELETSIARQQYEPNEIMEQGFIRLLEHVQKVRTTGTDVHIAVRPSKVSVVFEAYIRAPDNTLHEICKRLMECRINANTEAKYRHDYEIVLPTDKAIRIPHEKVLAEFDVFIHAYAETLWSFNHVLQLNFRSDTCTRFPGHPSATTYHQYRT